MADGINEDHSVRLYNLYGSLQKEMAQNCKDIRDEINNNHKTLLVAVTELQVSVKGLPSIPDRPCHFHDELKQVFEDHVENANETVRTWKTAAINGAVKIIVAAILSVGVVLIGQAIAGN